MKKRKLVINSQYGKGGVIFLPNSIITAIKLVIQLIRMAEPTPNTMMVDAI
ncbi:MAG: hypothetical protein QM731_04940 [Chitinophagaceae bacterium]